jgi:hypothetical protein
MPNQLQQNEDFIHPVELVQFAPPVAVYSAERAATSPSAHSVPRIGSEPPDTRRRMMMPHWTRRLGENSAG